MNTAESKREALARGLYYNLFTQQFTGSVSTEGVVEGPSPVEWDQSPNKAIVYTVADRVLAAIDAGMMRLEWIGDYN